MVKAIKFLLMVFFGFASINAHAGIPVIDGASIALAATNQASTMVEWGTQLASMAEQYGQQLVMQQVFSGNRGLGTILNNPAASSNLPANWDSSMSAMQSTPAYASILSSLPPTAAIGYGVATQQDSALQMEASRQSMLQNLYQNAAARVSQQASLASQINGQTDPAAKQDLSNRLISEQNSIASEQQLQTLAIKNAAVASDAAQQQAALERAANEFAH